MAIAGRPGLIHLALHEEESAPLPLPRVTTGPLELATFKLLRGAMPSYGSHGLRHWPSGHHSEPLGITCPNELPQPNLHACKCRSLTARSTSCGPYDNYRASNGCKEQNQARGSPHSWTNLCASMLLWPADDRLYLRRSGAQSSALKFRSGQAKGRQIQSGKEPSSGFHAAKCKLWHQSKPSRTVSSSPL